MSGSTLSVFVMNYNHADFLREALGSIVAQSFKPLELIVVDDASTDNSREVIESFARRNPNIRLICNERNIGAVRSAIRPMDVACGDYVCGVAADDLVAPGFLAPLIQVSMLPLMV